MREHVRALGDERGAVAADRATGREVLVVDRLGLPLERRGELGVATASGPCGPGTAGHARQRPG